MTERRESQEINRAARQMAAAARDLSRSVGRLASLEAESQRAYRRFLEGVGGMGEGPPLFVVASLPSLSDEESVLFAVQSVREVREDLWADREAEAPAPDSEDIEKWEMMRQNRRQEEGYELP